MLPLLSKRTVSCGAWSSILYCVRDINNRCQRHFTSPPVPSDHGVVGMEGCYLLTTKHPLQWCLPLKAEQ